MALVVDAVDHVTIRGIITLEDVFEELIQEEIRDETGKLANSSPTQDSGRERCDDESGLTSRTPPGLSLPCVLCGVCVVCATQTLSGALQRR
jgi:hypothetical protein